MSCPTPFFVNSVTTTSMSAREGHAKGRKLVFLHVPKAAGTTVGEAIREWFHRDDVMPAPSGQMIPANHPELALAAQKYSLFGVGVHFDHDQVEAIRAALPHSERPFVFTVLREPRARLISQYMHWRRTPDTHLAVMSKSNQDAFIAARNLGLGQFLRCGLPLVDVHFRNFQTRVLAGGTTKAAMSPDEVLETALSHAAEMDLIGTASHIDMTLKGLANAFGRVPPDTAAFLNASTDRPPLTFDEDTEAAIADFLSLDMKLWHAIHAGEWKLPKSPRRRFFSVDQELVSSLLGTGSSVFRMDMPLDGSGWHVREGVSPVARWTGPTKRSVIRLQSPASQRLSLTLQIVSVLDHRVLDDLLLTLNDTRPSGPLVRSVRDGLPEIQADFVLPAPPGATCDLTIEVPHTTSHDEVLGDVGDPRQKGVAIGAINLVVSGGNSPATLGDLFWTGEPWSSEDPAKVADLLVIQRDALPIPAAERSLALDLPLLAGLIELTKPYLVYCLEASCPLVGLRSLRCGTAPQHRVAILCTLFEMYDKAAIVPALAAQHEEAVLLLAFAEDSRLRTVIQHPFVRPHVHLIGGTSGILIANLSAMRRMGGPALLDAFFWILSRISATTPERIVRCDDPVQRAFLEREVVLALNVILETANPQQTSDITRALSATLRPEQAGRLQIAAAHERLTAALSQAGTYLDLVDHALVDELRHSLHKLAQHAVEQVSFDTLVTAHRAAFRISEMLVSWRRFGLDTNATATLGQELAAARKKEHNESAAQPLQVGVDAMVDAVLSAAKKTTLALSAAAGKLDSKVIHCDADALISVALAAAQHTSEILPKAARRFVGNALHPHDDLSVGILRPKPLKPFGEYIDFYRTEARIMGRQGVGTGIRLPLDGLRGGLDHVIRLNQAAREVEVALRLLGDHFPAEEIVWVDAGCSYGVLLNTVEPPSNIRDRCRFLGFDFNAPAVAVGRAAAVNMDRKHCNFEVGDVADAKSITGNSRIHLITAFEVLEHCPDPLAVLRDYRGMEPGMLVVGSPLSEPQGFLPTEQHLWVWDAGGFTQMVEAAGFAPIGVNQRHVGKFIGGHDWVTVTAVTAEVKDYAVV